MVNDSNRNKEISPSNIDTFLDIVSNIFKAISKINDRLDSFEKNSSEKDKKFLNIQEVSKFTGIAVNTIYQYTSSGKWPYYKIGNKLFFRKSEIENLLISSRYPTVSEMEAEAQANILKKNRN